MDGLGDAVVCIEVPQPKARSIYLFSYSFRVGESVTMRPLKAKVKENKLFDFALIYQSLAMR